jgi:membrane-associated phospholipid phosphatase
MPQTRSVGSRARLIQSIDRRHGLMNALFPPWTPAIHWRLLAIAVVVLGAAAGLAYYIKANPYIQLDDQLDRAIQSVNWGQLMQAFPFFSWVGGPGGLYMQATAVVVVLLLNRRAWLFALAALAGGLSYLIVVGIVHRPRPTLDQVIHITERPGSTSFPSGHVIFITISLGLVMLAVGQRYLPYWGKVVGWAVVAAIILAAGINRVYVGAHWPTDVLAGILLAGGWLCLVTSIRWLSDRALHGDAP